MTLQDGHLLELLGALCNGNITAEEEQHLAQRLREDPAARSFYVQYVDLHLALADAAVELPRPRQTPVPSFVAGAWQGTVAYFAQVGPLSYLIATAIFCVAAVVSSFCYVSLEPQTWPDDSRRLTVAGERAAGEDASSEQQCVGRITGMVDCRWAGTDAAPAAAVTLGHKYVLNSGLMEIAYASGAKVILQGPCTYEVDSAAGGFLALGKLTARVEKSEVRNPKSEAPNPQSLIPNPLFVVKTPTAVVTDLGTEFGVEVDQSGATRSHVFQGRVRLRLAGGDASGRPSLLGAGESAVVEAGGESAVRVLHGREQSKAMVYVRAMPGRRPIAVFNTGIGLKEGAPDPHWQIVARSDDPHFKARLAVVTSRGTGWERVVWLENEPRRSQWISLANGPPEVPDGVVYTFRTTFELADARLETAVMRGWFVADDHVIAIRINGKPVQAPPWQDGDFLDRYKTFWIREGFVEGANVLEFDVLNGQQLGRGGGASPMGFLAELEGTCVTGGRARPEPASGGGPPSPSRGKPRKEV